jgi:hypothetical protein
VSQGAEHRVDVAIVTAIGFEFDVMWNATAGVVAGSSWRARGGQGLPRYKLRNHKKVAPKRPELAPLACKSWLAAHSASIAWRGHRTLTAIGDGDARLWGGTAVMPPHWMNCADDYNPEMPSCRALCWSGHTPGHARNAAMRCILAQLAVIPQYPLFSRPR